MPKKRKGKVAWESRFPDAYRNRQVKLPPTAPPTSVEKSPICGLDNDPPELVDGLPAKLPRHQARTTSVGPSFSGDPSSSTTNQYQSPRRPGINGFPKDFATIGPCPPTAAEVTVANSASSRSYQRDFNLAGALDVSGSSEDKQEVPETKDEQEVEEGTSFLARLEDLDLEAALPSLNFDPPPFLLLKKYRQLRDSKNAGTLESTTLEYRFAFEIIINYLVIDYFAEVPPVMKLASDFFFRETTRAAIINHFKMDPEDFDLFDRSLHELLDGYGYREGYVAARALYGPIAKWFSACLGASELYKPNGKALRSAPIMRKYMGSTKGLMMRY